MFSKLKTMNREHLAWYLYDFGNSAYAAVVLLAIYSAYFKGEVVGGAEGSRLWGISIGIAMLVVAVIAPILGSLADFSASKKKFLLGFSIVTWTFTALLFFVQKGDIFLGMTFFILAEIGYRGGQVFYNSLLPEIAEPEELGRVSGNGWAIGSLGGILCLLIVLPPIVIVGGTLVVRLALVFTSVFFVISAIPVFRWIQERAQAQTLPEGESYISIAFKRIGKTFRSIRHFKEFIKFIVAFLIYNDGILMAMNFAAIIGAVLFGMNQTQLIIFMIVVQVTSVAGAYLFAVIGDKFGYKRSLIFSVVMMIGVVVAMLFTRTLNGYFVIGAFAGFALTGVQSLSRTMVGLFAPEGRSGEFFGFFAIAGRTSSFIGPTVYGIIAAEAAIFYAADRGMDLLSAEIAGQRAAIVSIIFFLLAGLIILLAVNEAKARAASFESPIAAVD
ncbi:MAG: MFS transporter [Anaerolineales bacterium]|nr:MFS transporter [Chloroflexota bacterium]MBL6980013.1 MFS transporter [Anaerolineales bacterium]